MLVHDICGGNIYYGTTTTGGNVVHITVDDPTIYHDLVTIRDMVKLFRRIGEDEVLVLSHNGRNTTGYIGYAD